MWAGTEVPWLQASTELSARLVYYCESRSFWPVKFSSDWSPSQDLCFKFKSTLHDSIYMNCLEQTNL